MLSLDSRQRLDSCKREISSHALPIIHAASIWRPKLVFALCGGQVSDKVKSAMANKLLATPRPEQHAVGGNVPVVLSDDESVELVDLVDED